MLKNALMVSAISLIIIIFIVGCAPTITEKPQEEMPATGQEQVDEVAQDISDISQTDEELDDSGLEDLENVLADIENI